MRKASSDTMIRATCETCGDVELRVTDFQVLLCATTNEGSYVFRCPICRLAVSKPADARIVDVLIAAGVELVVWDMPAELAEEHAGPPISYDDLIEFHFQLDDGQADAALADLVGERRSAHPAGSRWRGRTRR